MKQLPLPIRLFPEQERRSRTGQRCLETLFHTSVVRKKSLRKSLCVSGGMQMTRRSRLFLQLHQSLPASVSVYRQELKLPSAPEHFIQYLEEDNRPQVSLDVNFEHGMGISVGRLREDTVYDWKFVGLSHNTVRGAAGGAVLCAELLKAQGYITKK